MTSCKSLQNILLDTGVVIEQPLDTELAVEHPLDTGLVEEETPPVDGGSKVGSSCPLQVAGRDSSCWWR